MRILITGGCGFIGSNFIRYILKKHADYQVTNLDRLSYAGNLKNLEDIEQEYESRYEFIKGGVCDKTLVSKVMKNADLIFHFAAESHVDTSIENPLIFTKNNVMGTHVMLEVAKKENEKRIRSGKSQLKFIHISTDEVYGSVKTGKTSEDDLFNPSNPYSASKSGADLLARAYYYTYGLPVIITRSSNNFGPFQYPEKIIPLFITNIIEGKGVPVYSDGLNVRNWIYVLDNCAGIDFISMNGDAGEVYNIGGDNEISNIELTKIILSRMGKDESFIEFVKDRPGHDFRYSLNCDKINKLGWKPVVDFNSAINDTILWYESNKDWWEPLKKKINKLKVKKSKS